MKTIAIISDNAQVIAGFRSFAGAISPDLAVRQFTVGSLEEAQEIIKTYERQTTSEDDSPVSGQERNVSEGGVSSHDVRTGRDS